MHPVAVTSIRLHRFFGVNCYLIDSGDGFVLVDSGMASRRAELRMRLEEAGCGPGDLRLVVLTHAHSDHAGNCAHLKQAFGAPVAMHAGDARKAVSGDMLAGRARGGPFGRRLAARFLAVSRLGVFPRFEPDLFVEEGWKCDEFGLEATVVHLPGHSEGSIGVRTAAGDLFCGDVLVNGKQPEPTTLVDDPVAMQRSLDRLAGLGIGTVFPGHGRPFRMADYLGGPTAAE